MQMLSKVGGSAIQSIAWTGTLSDERGQTGYNNYGSWRDRTVASFGASGSYDTNGYIPIVMPNDSDVRDFRDYGMDLTAGTSMSYMVVSGRHDSPVGTNNTFTTTIALPADASTVRIYLGNSQVWPGQTNVPDDNKGYTFSAALSGATTYSSTDWFTRQFSFNNGTMTAGEVGYMQLTATPDNAGDLLTLTFNNTSTGRRDIFMQGVTVSSAVPEPTSLGLIALGACALLKRRAR